MRAFLLICGLAILAGCTIVVAAPKGSEASYEWQFGGDRVVGNGQLTTERRAVDGSATEVEVSGPIDLEIQVGPVASLEVQADGNLLPLLRSEMHGNTLRLFTNGSLRTEHDIRAKLTLPLLRRVGASGSGQVLVNGLKGGDFTVTSSGSRALQLSGSVGRLEVRLHGSSHVNAQALDVDSANVDASGSSHVALGRLHGEELNVDISGSGSLKAAGDVRRLKVSLSGAASANLKALKSETASLSTSGSADIDAFVSQSVTARTSGAGSITVAGNPAQRNVSGRGVSVTQ
jgi:hypothetical protein